MNNSPRALYNRVFGPRGLKKYESLEGKGGTWIKGVPLDAPSFSHVRFGHRRKQRAFALLQRPRVKCRIRGSYGGVVFGPVGILKNKAQFAGFRASRV